jgi:hypothetical protein
MFYHDLLVRVTTYFSDGLVFFCWLTWDEIRRYSFKFNQMSPMRWTPQLEGYLTDIEKAHHCPMDEILATQVRLQLLTQQAGEQRNQWSRETTPGIAPSFAEPFPSSLHFRTFRTKLQDIQASIPQRLREDSKSPQFILHSS